MHNRFEDISFTFVIFASISVLGIMNMAGAIPGFIAVYIAGYLLEVTKSWTLVFTQTAVVCCIGWALFLVFGTGKKIV